MQRLKYYYRLLTTPLRRKPDFLIIGAQKSGTSSLYAMLKQHPSLASSRRKEVHYYDGSYSRSFSFYRTWFPVNVSRKAFEATPIYLYHPLIPERIHEDLPKAKFIVSLRDPVNRAYSHYQMVKYKGFEDLDFKNALNAESERLATGMQKLKDEGFSIEIQRYSYQARGRYAEQLKRWFELYPRESFHIIFYEELISDTEKTFRGICEFLEIAPTEAELPHYNPHKYPPMPEDIKQQLQEYYHEPNVELASLLNRQLPW